MEKQTRELWVARIDTLVTKGEALRPSGPQSVEPMSWAEWKAQAVAALTELPGADPYLRSFESYVKGNYFQHAQAAVGVLKGLLEDLRAGYLVRGEDLIAASVFEDFLEMSRGLLDADYIHAAASLCGAVLEEMLRRLLKNAGKVYRGNLQSLNDMCAQAHLYSSVDHGLIKGYAILRNHADHGNFEEVDASTTRHMVQWVTEFVGRSIAGRSS